MKNAKDRRENNLLEPDFFDSQMLWVMLRHLRADRRRRVSFCSLVNLDYIFDINFLMMHTSRVKFLCIQIIIYNRKGLLLETMRTRSPERIPIQSPKERKAEVHIKYFVTINKSFEKQMNLLRVKRRFLIISEDHSSGESDSDGGSGMPQCQQS